MSKIMIGNIIRCPEYNEEEEDELWMRTIIVNGIPQTAYSKNSKELEGL